ncbi:uncharacterized protein SEPMUDRAFT_110509 [Sphaerulina musiva SO2202]|uniref:Uncharacterized protein n=1 Tax=Sphaerulina musiva (strain SO2202) TaxID=692275 RepID=M3D0V2_SPHMS|nr:uncharacterized protein SEPMUDRAFT_110509 [Sphaerulina musiva SO2202]EMF10118.1 hypothetical protein SEPMUDRAFT_110509 [Sphaerulina musiva SO2202]
MKAQIFLQACTLFAAVAAAPYPNERRDPVSNPGMPSAYRPKVQVTEAEVKEVEARAANTKRYTPKSQVKEPEVRKEADLMKRYSPAYEVKEAEVRKEADLMKRYTPKSQVKEVNVEFDGDS